MTKQLLDISTQDISTLKPVLKLILTFNINREDKFDNGFAGKNMHINVVNDQAKTVCFKCEYESI